MYKRVSNHLLNFNKQRKDIFIEMTSALHNHVLMRLLISFILNN